MNTSIIDYLVLTSHYQNSRITQKPYYSVEIVLLIIMLEKQYMKPCSISPLQKIALSPGQKYYNHNSLKPNHATDTPSSGVKSNSNPPIAHPYDLVNL